jgi:predicted Rossmann fold flavoprotein
MKNSHIIIIGAGAAGIFAAANISAKHPGIQVTVLEKSSKLLSKVKVSGGGRCNVTNSCKEPHQLIKNYPRGNKKLVQAFAKFGTEDTVRWFEERAVKLKTEADGRIFPVSDNSQTIIDCLLAACERNGVKILPHTGVDQIIRQENGFTLVTAAGETMQCEKLLVATGGGNKVETYHWLEKLGHSIAPPVPSLFTFNLKDKAITELAGVSVPEVTVKIAGTKLEQKGPILITHWGLSGPVVLRSSAWGARILHDKNYDYRVLVNWLSEQKEPEARKALEAYKSKHPKQKIMGNPLFSLPKRLWEFLCTKAGIGEETFWNNYSGKSYNRLINILVADEYQAAGKTTFKEEFVTCGGIPLSEVHLQTMESRICPDLYFAGEVLDIDGITGGFNFQAAWTTGWLAAQALLKDQ